MRRVGRYILNVTAAFSLILFGLAAAGWVRSHWVADYADGAAYTATGIRYAVAMSHRGWVMVEWVNGWPSGGMWERGVIPVEDEPQIVEVVRGPSATREFPGVTVGRMQSAQVRLVRSGQVVLTTPRMFPVRSVAVRWWLICLLTLLLPLAWLVRRAVAWCQQFRERQTGGFPVRLAKRAAPEDPGAAKRLISVGSSDQ